MNIGFISASGNLGKSTLLLNIIVSLMKNHNNLRFNVIDTDQVQNTTKDTMALRKANGLSFKDIISKNDEIIKHLDIGYENKNNLYFVDIQGFIDERVGKILTKLDLIILLTNNETFVNNKTYKLYKLLKSNGYNNVKVLINKYEPDYLPYEVLKSIYKNDLLNTYIKNRKSFVKVYNNGSMDIDRFYSGVIGLFKLNKDIDNLSNEILSLIH